MQECSDINVFMDIPIEFSSEIESLYEMLAKAGYDLFNAKSSFYNDICTTYTNEEGSDVDTKGLYIATMDELFGLGFHLNLNHIELFL